MNILLINPYAGSDALGMEYRPFYLSNEWKKLGHNVTIVGASYSHLRIKQPLCAKAVNIEEINEVKYIWIKTPVYHGNGIGRVLNMFLFIVRLFRHYKKIISISHPDVVIASSPHPFIIYPASKIAKKSHCKLFFEVRDLWPLSLVEIGAVSKYHPFIFLMQRTENYAYRIADKIISLLPHAKEYMESHGMESGKYAYIPNGIDVDEWLKDQNDIPKEHYNLLNEYKRNNSFIVGYVGAHEQSNSLCTLIKVAKLLQFNKVYFVFVGKGHEKDKLEKMVSDLGLKNVLFLNPVSKQSVPSMLNMMDALYIGWQNKNIYRFGISPNKLFDYMASGKPVIHAITGSNDLVAESGCGISVPAENADEIAKAIDKLQTMSLVEREEMGQKGKRFVLQHHDYRVLAVKYLELLRS